MPTLCGNFCGNSRGPSNVFCAAAAACGDSRIPYLSKYMKINALYAFQGAHDIGPGGIGDGERFSHLHSFAAAVLRKSIASFHFTFWPLLTLEYLFSSI